MEKYHVGDTIDGIVTGATEFGVFVKLEEGLEGLVHISEMDWALVENPKTRYKGGDAVKVKVIEIKDDKISLSIKALLEDPWKSAAAKYKKDQRVEAVVIKYNKHGALASIEEGVAGLVHISEFGKRRRAAREARARQGVSVHDHLLRAERTPHDSQTHRLRLNLDKYKPHFHPSRLNLDGFWLFAVYYLHGARGHASSGRVLSYLQPRN